MKVLLIAFRGIGFRKAEFKNEPALVKSGHVGVAFETDPEVIYGFHPSAEAEKALGGEAALINALKNHERQAGKVQIDTEVFVRAYELFQQGVLGGQTEVLVLDYELEDEDYQQIRQKFLTWHQEETNFWYNFPDEDGKFRAGEFNCAVFPAQAGMPIPVEDGVINRYIEAMRQAGASQWQATKFS
jgi:hypothetical protein